MKQLLITCISLMFCFLASGQTDHLTIYKLPKTNSAKKFKINKTFTIGYDLEVSDTTRAWKLTEGKLTHVNSNTFTLLVHKMQTNSELKKNGTLSSSSEIVKYADTLTDAVHISYAIKDIEYLEISRSNEKLEGAGIVGVIFSALTTFVVAPLVSINYREGTFNSITYRNWALAGTAGMAVSFPFLIFSNKTKRYKINECWPGGGTKNWTTRK